MDTYVKLARPSATQRRFRAKKITKATRKQHALNTEGFDDLSSDDEEYNGLFHMFVSN